jgi:hypothetical protein
MGERINAGMLVKAPISIIIWVGFDNALFPPSAHSRHCRPQEACDFIDRQLAGRP